MPPIPLTFSVREADGSWIVSGTVAQASEVMDLLTHSANGTVVVMDQATTSFWSPARELWIRRSLPPNWESNVSCTGSARGPRPPRACRTSFW
ncbi:hypothetical protein [Streptodolium elevatio]